MPETIIRFDDVSFMYPGSSKFSLNNIRLEMNKGDFTAIIGGNGSGKTTLCKTINGIIPHYINGDFFGQINVCGMNTLSVPVTEISKRVSYIYQDFENQLVRSTVLDDVIFAPLNYGFTDYRQRGMDALILLGIENLKDRFIWELSGGQKHLTALAGALSIKPDIIIIDEPAAQLDPRNAEVIYKTLSFLNKNLGITIIVIEHNAELIAEHCNKVVLMDSGSIVWVKDVRDSFYALSELLSRNIHPPQVTHAAYLISADRHPYPITTFEAEKYFEHDLITDPAERSIVNYKCDNENDSVIVEFNAVSHSYKSLSENDRFVLDDITLSVNNGERVAIIGNNGAGKSTLLKMITGVLKPKCGQVTVCGMNTSKVLPEDIASKVAYIFQNPEKMFIEDSVYKDIVCFQKSRGKKHATEASDGIFDDIIEFFGLMEIQDKDGRMLSGGQQRRASLAIGSAMRPVLLLLDEPTGSLDFESRRDMIRILHYLKDRITTVIIATHDMQLVSEWANRVIVMKAGRIMADSDKHSVFDNTKLLHECNIKLPQITELSRRLGMTPLALNTDNFISRLKIPDKVVNS